MHTKRPVVTTPNQDMPRTNPNTALTNTTWQNNRNRDRTNSTVVTPPSNPGADAKYHSAVKQHLAGTAIGRITIGRIAISRTGPIRIGTGRTVTTLRGSLHTTRRVVIITTTTMICSWVEKPLQPHVALFAGGYSLLEQQLLAVLATAATVNITAALPTMGRFLRLQRSAPGPGDRQCPDRAPGAGILSGCGGWAHWSERARRAQELPTRPPVCAITATRSDGPTLQALGLD